MAGRASWSGYLRLSLVSCPVKLYSATSASAGKISFNLLHKDTHNRIQQRYHDPELGEVDRTDLVKGYQFEKDKYVVVTQDELEEIQVESSKTIDIDGFVDASAIDEIYLDTPYYMAPDGPIAEETYAVILEAMKKSKVVALARIVMSGRERLVAIHPLDGGFKVTTLRTAKEVKLPSTVFEPFKAKLTADMLAMAQQIIAKKKMKKFDASEFEDRYEAALMTLVQSKINGGKPVITKVPERGNVVNLMDALRRSIEEERRPAAPSLGKEKKAAKVAAPAKNAKKKARA
jgi:DNA end-binding protein Ku